MSHIGSLKHDSTFRHVFNKCLRGCYNEQEFEVTWNKMIVDYILRNDPWFIRLYAIRTKWCTALSKDFFSAGILSSQRSESTNHAISFNASRTTSLTDFYSIFSETVKRWRRQEERNEFQCSRSTPASYFHMGGLLRHASEVYTLNLFREFEKEFGIAMSTQTEICSIESAVYVYKVFLESPTDAAQFVSFDAVNVRIDCSCRKFQEAGLLCCHSIRVFHLHSISTIPENYISKRWTKYAKFDVWKRYEESDTRCNQDKDLKSWRCSMLRKFHNLIMKCQDVKEGKALLNEAYTRVLQQVSDLLESLRQNSTDMHLPSNVVLDPPRSKTN